VACKNHDPDSGVDFIGYCGDAYEQFEAQRIAEICTDIRDNQAPQSVAILVRSRGHLRAIIPALKRAGLEWQATDIDPLATRMAVVDLISLTRALVSPTDRIAWLAVLRAPFCGLDLADLLQISHSGADSSSQQPIIIEQLMQRFDAPDNPLMEALSEHGRMVLARIVPVLKKAWTHRSRTDLRIAVEQCWIGLGGYATLKSPSEQRDVERFLDLLSTHQVAGYIADWDALQLAVEKLYASPSVANNRINTRSGIQIMTIHKAKGLEFDQVLLPGLSRATPANDKPLLRWQELIDDSGSSELLMAARGAYDNDDDAHYQYLKYEQTQSIHLENTRIIYVAATRAISRLHLFAKLKKSGKAWSAPASGCLLAPIWKSLEADIEAQRFSVTVVEDETTASATAAQIVPQRRLPCHFSVHQPADGGIDNRPTTAAIEHHNQSTTTEPFDSNSLRARQLGNTLHRALKQVAVDGVEAWPKSRLQGLTKGWRWQLREAGVLASDNELRELLRAVTNTLADPTGLWLLNGYADSRTELALDYQFPDEPQVQRSIVDLTFIADQTRWIIDYKYTLPEHPDGLEEFIHTMQQRYTAQLQHYSRLLQELGPHPVRCGLYFPRIPMFMEISCD
jgi:ATP-dependent exoDNAse (exonuclease V) beta subunit